MNNPDALIPDDPESFAFFLLRDETIAICQRESEMPYHKNRASYLANGRVSPKYGRIVFWPDPINAKRAIDLLIAGNHITPTYTWEVAGSETVKTKTGTRAKAQPANPADRVTGIKRRNIENLVNAGMKVQGKPETDK